METKSRYSHTNLDNKSHGQHCESNNTDTNGIWEPVTQTDKLVESKATNLKVTSQLWPLLYLWQKKKKIPNTCFWTRSQFLSKDWVSTGFDSQENSNCLQSSVKYYWNGNKPNKTQKSKKQSLFYIVLYRDALSSILQFASTKFNMNYSGQNALYFYRNNLFNQKKQKCRRTKGLRSHPLDW